MKSKLNTIIPILIIIICSVAALYLQQQHSQKVIDNNSEKIIFSPPELLEATEGASYSYSFCKPDSAISGATCGGLAGTTINPYWGNPPYSFSVQFGNGFLPPGLALELNGLLRGTPTLPGTYPFGICAKDSQDEVCGTTTLTVKPKSEQPQKNSIKTAISGTGTGTITADPSNPNMVFDPSTTVKLTAVPAAGSTFDHWEGDCSGSKSSCALSMISNKTVTAVFNVINVTPKVTADVKINSFTCNWTVKSDEYGNKSDCLRAIAKGTAQGPVGVRVELPILIWSDDKWDCGAWTLKTGALITVGHTCVRKEGQPETTTWTVDTGGEKCPTKSVWDNNRSYSVKIYLNDDLDPQKTDSKTTVCQ